MQNLRKKLVALGSFLVLAVAGGCASPVPGGLGAATGKALIVTMTTSDVMNPQYYYYYFVINHVGANRALNGRGPIPVLGQVSSGATGGIGNGFTTGSPSTANTTNGVTDYGITDYVVYNSSLSSNEIALYHITPGTDPNITANAGLPQSLTGSYTLPDQNNNYPFTLTFTLPISQLFPKDTGPTLTNDVNNLQYIQVNIITTNLVPTDQTQSNGKIVDSMGDSTMLSNLTSYLTIDLSQIGKTYSGADIYQSLAPETAGDLYPPGSKAPSMDLVSWNIQVVQLN